MDNKLMQFMQRQNQAVLTPEQIAMAARMMSNINPAPSEVPMPMNPTRDMIPNIIKQLMKRKTGLLDVEDSPPPPANVTIGIRG